MANRKREWTAIVLSDRMKTISRESSRTLNANRAGWRSNPSVGQVLVDTPELMVVSDKWGRTILFIHRDLLE